MPWRSKENTPLYAGENIETSMVSGADESASQRDSSTTRYLRGRLGAFVSRDGAKMKAGTAQPCRAVIVYIRCQEIVSRALGELVAHHNSIKVGSPRL